MNVPHGLRILPALFLASQSIQPTLVANNLYWNPSGGSGDGIWGTSPGDKNWNTSPGAPAGNTFWQDGVDDVAVFQSATGGIVTVFDPVQTTGIIQDGANFTINASTITLATDSTASVPFIQVDEKGARLMIDSILDGNSGLIKNGRGRLVLTGDNLYSGTTVVADGSVILEGSLTSNVINISNVSELRNQSAGLPDETALTNAGVLMIDGISEIITSYTSNSGRLSSADGKTLFTTSAILDGNSQITSSLHSDTFASTGTSLITGSGSVTAGTSRIDSGILTLGGSLSTPSLTIARGGTLINQSGGLANSTVLTNAGTLTMAADDNVTRYLSQGGDLTAGPGTLFSNITELETGSTLAGKLNTNSLASRGAVEVSGTATATTIQIESGQLTNTGILGTPSSSIDIRGGAALVARGTQQYDLLTTSGATAGQWIGDLINSTNIAPGGRTGIGSLAVTGDFANTSTSHLQFEVGGIRNDQIIVSGNAHFDGALNLTQRGMPTFTLLSPINLVNASSYSGNITSLTENLDGAVWFNPGNGNLNLLGNLAGPNGALAGASTDQTSIWLALYDDVIDPGSSNVINVPGFNPGYDITSGLADISNPDLLWALDASFTPTGINGAMLNRLSPAIYVGLEDYAIQANRTYQRSALSAPPLSSSRAVQQDGKGGAKNANLGATPFDWELFAAVDFFNVDTGTAANQADYQLNGAGFIAGARVRATEDVQIAAYLAFDDGSIKGSLIDADGTGWSLGLLGQVMLEKETETRVSGGISYGSYHFNGNRTSVSATNNGWAAGPVGFSEVYSNSLELFVSIERILYQDDRIRVTPSAGMRYATGSLDSISEFTNAAPGAPIALIVGGDSYHSALAEFSLLAEAKLTRQLTLQGLIGINASLADDKRTLDARFAQSGANGRQISGTADGLSNSSVVLGLGAIHQFSDELSAALSYRAEFRDDSDTQQGVSISSSFRF